MDLIQLGYVVIIVLCWQGAGPRAKGPASSGLAVSIQTSLAVFTTRPKGNGCKRPHRV